MSLPHMHRGLTLVSGREGVEEDYITLRHFTSAVLDKS